MAAKTLGPLSSCKTVLLGESAVGKSSIVLKFVQHAFHDFQEPTIGAAFMTKTLNVGSAPVKFEIWDTAGQERYHSLTPMYYRGAKAAIVVYDVTNRKTFVRAQLWVKELQRYARNDVIIILTGNKSDLSNNRIVDYEEAENYAKAKELLFIETSAKTGKNVNKLFFTIGESLLANGTNEVVSSLSIQLCNSQMSFSKKAKLILCCTGQ